MTKNGAESVPPHGIISIANPDLHQRSVLTFAVFVERNRRLERAIFLKHPNLSTAKFHASFGIIDSTMFRAFAGPIRLYARRFKALPTTAEGPNFDDRSALLHGNS